MFNTWTSRIDLIIDKCIQNINYIRESTFDNKEMNHKDGLGEKLSIRFFNIVLYQDQAAQI